MTYNKAVDTITECVRKTHVAESLKKLHLLYPCIEALSALKLYRWHKVDPEDDSTLPPEHQEVLIKTYDGKYYITDRRDYNFYYGVGRTNIVAWKWIYRYIEE